GYAYTVKTVQQDGTPYADSLLRPHALNQARHEYKTMLDGVDLLMAKDPVFYRPVKEMIAIALEKSVLEGDYSHVDKQSKIAANHYDGLAVIADGKEHKFYTPKLVSHGAEYKRAAFVNGHHFLEPGTQTRADMKSLAKAIHTAELYTWL